MSAVLAAFVGAAEAAGAKLVLVGDPEQLQPINAGAAFRAVAERIGFVELEGVRRQGEDWQRAASQAFARHGTPEGISAYAQRGGVRLAETREEAGAAIVRDVLDDMTARPEGSPLHNKFQWDLEKAAYAQWLSTARNLIAAVRVEVTIRSVRILAPAFVRDPSALACETGYVSTGRLRNHSEMAREAVVAEINRVISAIQRARGVAASLGFPYDFDGVEDQAKDLLELAHHFVKAA